MSKWDRRMLGLVNLIATWSKDPSTGVGAAAEAEREACAALCDSKVMALDHGGKEYYRPAPADRIAAAHRARGNSAEGLV